MLRLPLQSLLAPADTSAGACAAVGSQPAGAQQACTAQTEVPPVDLAKHVLQQPLTGDVSALQLWDTDARGGGTELHCLHCSGCPAVVCVTCAATGLQVLTGDTGAMQLRDTAAWGRRSCTADTALQQMRGACTANGLQALTGVADALQLWDTAGRAAADLLGPRFFRSAACAVLVCNLQQHHCASSLSFWQAVVGCEVGVLLESHNVHAGLVPAWHGSMLPLWGCLRQSGSAA